jgi:hypothetical protein
MKCQWWHISPSTQVRSWSPEHRCDPVPTPTGKLLGSLIYSPNVLSVVGYIWETCCESIGSGQGFASSSFGFPKLSFSCCSMPTCRCPLVCVISLTRQHVFTSLVIKLQISSIWPDTWPVSEAQNKALRQILYKMEHFWDKYLVLGFLLS